MTPEILDHRTGDRPKVDLVAAVERMLSHLPLGYFARLGHVALRDAGGLTRRERLRRKKADPGMVLAGTYTRPTSRDPAHIDLFVDSIFAGLPSIMARIPLVRDVLLGKVLYHELGHHLHRVLRPEHRDLELVAEEWQKRLLREYFGRRYWYLAPIARPAARWARRRRRKRGRT